MAGRGAEPSGGEHGPPTADPRLQGVPGLQAVFPGRTHQECVQVSPLHQTFAPRYPVVQDLAFFARWSNAHGSYRVELQLRDLAGGVLWRDEMADPLQVVPLTLRHRHVRFPAPGKYEVALLANGQEVAADVFLAHLVEPPHAEPPSTGTRVGKRHAEAAFGSAPATSSRLQGQPARRPGRGAGALAAGGPVPPGAGSVPHRPGWGHRGVVRRHPLPRNTPARPNRHPPVVIPTFAAYQPTPGLTSGSVSRVRPPPTLRITPCVAAAPRPR
jgi:hypothetical protein